MNNIKQLITELGFEALPMLSEFVSKISGHLFTFEHSNPWWDFTSKYTDFITQPLTKGMFIPCDEEGNVLVEPIGYITWLDFDRSDNCDPRRPRARHA